MEQGQKKEWAKFLIGTAILLGIYKGMEPSDQEFDIGREYAPNKIQQKFIQLSAQENEYVGLSNTAHNRPEITQFSHNRWTLAALEKGGVKNYFMELIAKEQPKITAVQEGRASSYNYAARNMWLCSDEVKQSLNATFNQSAKYYSNIRFIAADQRSGGSAHPGPGLYSRSVLAASILAYKEVYGCVDKKAAILPMILTLGTLNSESSPADMDDTATSDYISAYPGKGAIFYGTEHYYASPGAKSMRTLLQTDKKTMTVIDIFKDAGQKKERDDLTRSEETRRGVKMKRPDAVFYVIPPPGNPDGIEVISPEAKAIYERAKENLRNLAIN